MKCIALSILATLAGVVAEAQVYHPIVLAIPVRDGNALAADLYTSDSTLAKPVILIQTPYNRLTYRIRVSSPLAGGSTVPFDTANYNYVVVDWRGFYGSVAASVPGYDRGLDGYDIIEWIAQRVWSNGKVGTYGGSALGMIQFQTARHRPPHLVCAVPMMKDYKTKYSDFYYGGDYRQEHVESLDSLGFFQTSAILAHPAKDLYWTSVENQSDYPETFSVPMLLVSGWYDHYPSDVLRAFTDICSRSELAVRGQHRLVMGPWLHGDMGDLDQGALEYPAAVNVDDSLAMLFLNHYLRGALNGWENGPVVRYYQLGDDQWRSAPSWPGTATRRDTLFFQEAGGLAQYRPAVLAGADSFAFDPRNPSPAVGGSRFNPFDKSILLGPQDQRALVESRNDVLVYSTDVLSMPLSITGPMKVVICISCDRTDTDFSIRLCDVFPDGRSMLMTMGIRRARFRDSFSTPERMIPGQVYQVVVDLQDIALTIKPGHRLRVIVSSSLYPHFALNLNNGGAMYVAGDTLSARTIVYRSSVSPSYVVLTTPSTAGVRPPAADVPISPELEQNYPNPFNPRTMIRYQVPAACNLILSVYDLLGREILVLAKGRRERGAYSVEFDSRGYASGVYLYRLQTDNVVRTRAMVLVK
jgi:predicted acyl esterase